MKHSLPTTISWTCESCDKQAGKITEFSKEAFLEHLRTVHKIDTIGLKGKKSLVTHINARPHHSYQYKWKIFDLVCYQFVSR